VYSVNVSGWAVRRMRNRRTAG